MTTRKQHWETVFGTKAERDVSWFEAAPDTSLRLLDATGMTLASCVLDVGGGDSHLVDHLIARGLRCLTVLDVSGAALARSQARLGWAASIPTWIESDVTGDWSVPPMDIWHDRAVFHFLTGADDRDRYRTHLLRTVKPGGSAIIATFALDGPEKCSGLPVMRYSRESLATELGPEFTLAESLPHIHSTPWGTTQSFIYCRFTRHS